MTFCRSLVCVVMQLATVSGYLTMISAAAAEGVVVRDARNREVTIENPSRIVSIGGAITEILYALGLEQRVVAVDTTSLFPDTALRAKVTKPVRVMFVMSLLNGRAMVAGQNTSANEIIKLSGGINAIDSYDGY